MDKQIAKEKGRGFKSAAFAEILGENDYFIPAPDAQKRAMRAERGSAVLSRQTGKSLKSWSDSAGRQGRASSAAARSAKRIK